MVKSRHICLFFLLIIFSHEFLSVEARKLKMTDSEFMSRRGAEIEARLVRQVASPVAAHVRHGSKDEVDGFVSGFRPTTPGHRPGVVAGYYHYKTCKKSPLSLRMVVLVFAMVCRVYICSVCLKQINIQTKTKFQCIQVVERPHNDKCIKLLENPYGHYPNPKTFSRGDCARNPVRFFAILPMQRSGSGWFESLLNGHINVSSKREIFSYWYRRDKISNIVQTRYKVYNLDWLSSASKNHCSAAVGFKWMLNQGLMVHYKEVVEYFNRRDVSAIFLFRRNLLRRMVSDLANSYDRYAKLLNGTHKSHVHSAEEAEKLSTYKPTINSTSLIADLEKIELTAARAVAYFNGTRHMVLYYEDVMTNRTKLKDVQEFQGLPQMELSSRQVKIHNSLLADLIKNWNDVNRTLKGTTYEHFLYKDY